jgi:hypothetical protein
MARTPVVPEATLVGAVSAQFEASKAAIRKGCFTSTPTVREVSGAPFDMIGIRLVGHDW